MSLKKTKNIKKRNTNKRKRRTSKLIIKGNKGSKELIYEQITRKIKKEMNIHEKKGLTKIIEIETDDSILKKYEDICIKNLKKMKNTNEMEKINKIIEENIKEKKDNELKELGRKLTEFLINFDIKNEKTKRNNNIDLSFGQSIKDKDFMNIVINRIKYIKKNYSENYINYLKSEFIKYKDEISKLFISQKLIKDLLENTKFENNTVISLTTTGSYVGGSIYWTGNYGSINNNHYYFSSLLKK